PSSWGRRRRWEVSRVRGRGMGSESTVGMAGGRLECVHDAPGEVTSDRRRWARDGGGGERHARGVRSDRVSGRPRGCGDVAFGGGAAVPGAAARLLAGAGAELDRRGRRSWLAPG